MSVANLYLCPLFNGTTQLLANGQPNVNGNVYFYHANTSNTSNFTPANTATSNTGSANNPNPLTIGLGGIIPNQIWLPIGQNTKILITDSSNNTLDIEDQLLGVDDPTYSTSIANAAYTLANAAFSVANSVNSNSGTANVIATAALTKAASAANSVAVYANGSLIEANTYLNFNNTSTVNANVTVAIISANLVLPTANVQLDANTSAFSNVGGSKGTANGYANVTSNVSVRWGSVYVASPVPPASGGSTYPVTFAIPFYSQCFDVQLSMTSTGSGEDAYPRISNSGLPTRTGFSFEFSAFGSSFGSTTVYWMAIGDTAG